MTISIVSKSELMNPNDLLQNKRNSAIHPPEQVTALANSFKKYGFIGSVVIDAKKTIIAGHGRVLAAIEAGMEQIPVILADHLSEAEVRQFLILDNELAKQKTTDYELLASEIKDLSIDFNFADFNFDVSKIISDFENDSDRSYQDSSSEESKSEVGERESLTHENDDDESLEPEEFDSYLPKPDEEETSSAEDNDAPIPFEVEARVTPGSAWRLGKHLLVCGNSSDASTVHKFIAEESAHAIVTDPPYGISFMGKEWDHGVPSEELWKVWISRITPGAHILSFCATRMYHHMAINIERAGFEPRDMIAWMYGSGFPKSLDISKAMDKEAGATREVVGKGPKLKPMNNGSYGSSRPDAVETIITAPETNEAKRWNGWGTALKPSQEPIMLARKPIAEKTVAKNVVKHGTGGLNIDGSRVKASADDIAGMLRSKGTNIKGQAYVTSGRDENWTPDYTPPPPNASGRWPANTILSHADECVEVGLKNIKGGSGWSKSGSKESENSAMSGKNYARDAKPDSFASEDGTETVEAWECVDGCPVRELDIQSGNVKGMVGMKKIEGKANHEPGGSIPGQKFSRGVEDNGGASRFFYVPKPSKSDKSQGNNHETVKPIRLMEYLIRMINPQGGTVLEPFAGSGTTLLACQRLNMKCVAFELDPHHCDIILHRFETMTGLKAEGVSIAAEIF